jgi:hypothetical protein
MKKLTGIMFVVALCVALQAPQAHAATTTAATTTVASSTTTTTSSVTSLMEKLKALMAKVEELKAELFKVRGELGDVLKEGLKEGMTDEDIKELQALLASDPSIYPAGKVTGFFGPLTTEAIKKFQLKNGLEVTGVIDTETKAALDTIMEQRKADGKIPLGFMFRPDMKEKFEHKLRVRCDDVIVASSTPSTVPCKKMKEKYKFEVDDKGRIKMEYEVEDEDEDEDEDENEDSDDDNSNDDDDSDDDDDDDDNEDDDDEDEDEDEDDDDDDSDDDN